MSVRIAILGATGAVGSALAGHLAMRRLLEPEDRLLLVGHGVSSGERRLLADYEAALGKLVAGLTRERLPLAVKIAQVPDQIRGFGHVKDAAINVAKAEEAKLWAQWDAAAAPSRPLVTA